MGSQWLNSSLATQFTVKMEGYSVLLVIVGLGSISADTNLLESPALPAFSAQPAFDNSGYYSTYPSASGYDYDAGYPVQALGEQDRQDLLSTGLFGGITIAMFLTAFLAALLGALVAPALTAGITRISEFELPEITLPGLPIEAVEEVRALKDKYPWVGMAENVYGALKDEWNSRQGSKFNKFINNNKL